ncbi:sensor histidine kinase [Lederbergia graminis]|uniref:Sensor histidine kinase n=1 Tax=Lederbergia graminis TaxID=735518 RepID=A0ABW0LME0_9BACI
MKKGIGIRSKLLISYLIISFFPILILATQYYDTSKEELSNLARKNVYEIIKKNNDLIDSVLGGVEDSTLSITVDDDLFKIFNNLNPENNIQLLIADRDLRKISSQYVLKWSGVDSVQYVTSYFTFGDNTPLIRFRDTDYYNSALEGKGKLQWIPTYNIKELLNDENLFEDDYIFSAARLLNISYVRNGVISNLPMSVERPVLFIHFKADFYDQYIKDSIPIKGSDYMVITKEGQVISHKNQSLIGTNYDADWVESIVEEQSGTKLVKINGKNTIICFDTSDVTGWISIGMITEGDLVDEIVHSIKFNMFTFAIILVFISLLLAFIFSGRITKPIKKLLFAIRKMGQGSFDTKVEVTNNDEFGHLIRNFNTMNEQIRLLIQENYEVKLKEKETEIMALNVQLNPHFLYNTLNTMNWIAIENGQKELSKMLISISKMLHYTTNITSETGLVKEELEWLKSYTHIMSSRFEGVFTVEFDIDPSLVDWKIPRLMLQPFIENAIIHGFELIEEGGFIRITGIVESDTIIFCIEDNGKGMDKRKIKEVIEGSSDSVGIYNVDKRIKLLYGENYGVKLDSVQGSWTKVEIILPKNSPPIQKH